MAQKKYVSLSKLSSFLDSIKKTFATITHKHTISDLTDYKVDEALSSISTNPVQNKVIDAEFDSIAKAMDVLENVIDSKSDLSHIHEISNINTLQEALDSKSTVQIISWGDDD